MNWDMHRTRLSYVLPSARTTYPALTIGNVELTRKKKYRPIYDGAGNIRLDYMDAILHEITYGVQPADYRSVFEVIVLETPSSTSSSDSSPDS